MIRHTPFKPLVLPTLIASVLSASYSFNAVGDTCDTCYTQGYNAKVCPVAGDRYQEGFDAGTASCSKNIYDPLTHRTVPIAEQFCYEKLPNTYDPSYQGIYNTKDQRPVSINEVCGVTNANTYDPNTQKIVGRNESTYDPNYQRVVGSTEICGATNIYDLNNEEKNPKGTAAKVAHLTNDNLFIPPESYSSTVTSILSKTQNIMVEQSQLTGSTGLAHGWIKLDWTHSLIFNKSDPMITQGEKTVPTGKPSQCGEVFHYPLSSLDYTKFDAKRPVCLEDLGTDQKTLTDIGKTNLATCQTLQTNNNLSTCSALSSSLSICNELKNSGTLDLFSGNSPVLLKKPIKLTVENNGNGKIILNGYSIDENTEQKITMSTIYSDVLLTIIPDKGYSVDTAVSASTCLASAGVPLKELGDTKIYSIKGVTSDVSCKVGFKQNTPNTIEVAFDSTKGKVVVDNAKLSSTTNSRTYNIEMNQAEKPRVGVIPISPNLLLTTSTCISSDGATKFEFGQTNPLPLTSDKSWKCTVEFTTPATMPTTTTNRNINVIFDSTQGSVMLAALTPTGDCKTGCTYVVSTDAVSLTATAKTGFSLDTVSCGTNATNLTSTVTNGATLDKTITNCKVTFK